MLMNWLSTMSDAAATAAAETVKNSDFAGLSLVDKGLLTTGVGLLGVFLVLGILFVTIKLMQRIKTKDKGGEE